LGRKKATTAVDATLLAQVEGDLRSIPKSAVTIKLKAIKATGEGHTLKVVSEVIGCTQNTLFRWVRAYKEIGLNGLIDRPKGHRAKRLSPEHEMIIRDWITHQITPDGLPVHWTVNLLREAIMERLQVQISYTRLWTWMHLQNFKQKTPRPRHIQSDPLKQEEFKKKSSRKGSGGKASGN